MAQDPFGDAISRFGEATTSKLSNVTASGAAEDQLRGPLEALIKDIGAARGMARNDIVLVGEYTAPDKRSRPDYAVVVRDALVGFIEVKAPGKGADPRTFKDAHDLRQWGKLRLLPNLLYTDGNSFGLWRDGELVGHVVGVEGDVRTSGIELRAPQGLDDRIGDFLAWKPISPSTIKQLAVICARLCRILRTEVIEELGRDDHTLSNLAGEWRKHLFPNATDAEFADGYAQAVTFGLLLARERNISLAAGIDPAAYELRRTNSVIGMALRVLTDDPNNTGILRTSLDTMTRVLDAVDWPRIARGRADAWLYFYEDFLAVYDKDLRKQTGSYYTPAEVVDAMVRLVDEVLRDKGRFGLGLGLASPGVTVVDPAVGTGTFLMSILKRISTNVASDTGEGSIPNAIKDAIDRLVGFELQLGPFAVAQLRMLAEVRRLIEGPPEEKAKVNAKVRRDAKASSTSGRPPDLRLYVTDTLASPYEEGDWYTVMLGALSESRRKANLVKREEPITVVIGNPPYKDNARGRGGWVENGDAETIAPLGRWALPVEWGLSAQSRNLRNLYVYFWRWATWKVFGDEPEPTAAARAGVVCYITVSGFLNGDGFQMMRRDLRRSSKEIWVIDCSPEGHQPETNTRVFQGVQQPVCIVLAVRTPDTLASEPAKVRFTSLPLGRRAGKFAALASLSLDGPGWKDCPTDWRAPFLPQRVGAWATFPALKGLFSYDGPGVMPGRTWVVSPDAKTLNDRWDRLIGEPDEDTKEALFHPQLRKGKLASRHIRKVVLQDLGSRRTRTVSVHDDRERAVPPIRYGFRSFDRQWIIPDARLFNDVRPELWRTQSDRQVYLTTLEAHSVTNGPAVTFTGLVPDQHHYKGDFGGRAYPLWSDADATASNVAPAFLEFLTASFGRPVSGEDVMAYVAGVMAHPAFGARFSSDLKRPGLRIPITKDVALFEQAIEIGAEIIWLHTYGERYADAGKGRPEGSIRLGKDGPTIPGGGTIRGADGTLPETMTHDAAGRMLRIGEGFVLNVDIAVWKYEVSGKQVVRQWFSYRKNDRKRPQIGDRRPPSELESTRPNGWVVDYDRDLIDLLHVLTRVVSKEAAQAELLETICQGPTFGEDELLSAKAIVPRVKAARKSSKPKNSDQMAFLP